MSTQDSLDGEAWNRLMLTAADALEGQADMLSQLDAAGGDGDHGVNVATAMQQTRRDLGVLTDPTPGDVLLVTARAFLDEMGGAAGALFGSFFRAVGRSFGDDDLIGTSDLAGAIEAGTEVVKKRGKAEPGDKTMVDALAPAAAAARSAADGSMTDALSRMAEAAREGAAATSEMMPAVGRARFSEERTVGIQDPGATTVALMFEAWAAAMEET